MWVTGVQTCALPILEVRNERERSVRRFSFIFFSLEKKISSYLEQSKEPWHTRACRPSSVRGPWAAGCSVPVVFQKKIIALTFPFLMIFKVFLLNNYCPYLNKYQISCRSSCGLWMLNFMEYFTGDELSDVPTQAYFAPYRDTYSTLYHYYMETNFSYYLNNRTILQILEANFQ